MNAKKLGITAGLLLTLLFTVFLHTEIPSQLGLWLRTLSLSGNAGNIAAWAAVLFLTALPALGLLWRGRCGWDWLLLLASLQILTGLYFLVNPTLLHPAFDLSRMWAVTAAVGTAATLTAWAALRTLVRLENAVSPGRTLARLLRGAACLYLCLSGWEHAIALYRNISQVMEGNTDLSAPEVRATCFILVLLTILDMIPAFLGSMVLIWGGGLARALENAPFSADTALLAERLSRRCAQTASASVLICAGGNALQMFCFSYLRQINAYVSFPVITVLLAAALGLLCRYIRRAKAVSDDNESII